MSVSPDDELEIASEMVQYGYSMEPSPGAERGVQLCAST